MCLCVPVGKIAHEAFAVRPRLIGFGRVFGFGTAEDGVPIVARREAVGMIDGVPAFVPQQLLAPLGRAAFHLQHLMQLESFQARMR